MKRFSQTARACCLSASVLSPMAKKSRPSLLTLTSLLSSSAPHQQQQQYRFYQFNNGTENLSIEELRAKIHRQQKDVKIHIVDKIQSQVELALKLANQPTREEREEAMGRGEALWKMLMPNHPLAPQIPMPTRTAVRIILSETMLECAMSVQDSEAISEWEERFKSRKNISMNPRDFDGPRQDPMAVFQFSENYGHSGVVGGSAAAAHFPSASSEAFKKNKEGGGGGMRKQFYDGGLDDDDEEDAFENDLFAPKKRGNGAAASSSNANEGNGNDGENADDDDEDDISKFLKSKLKAEGIDKRALRAERRSFEAEDAERCAEMYAQNNGKKKGPDGEGGEGDGGNTAHFDDDEKTRQAKEKIRKLFGDQNTNMGKHRQSVFNEHPMFTRNQPKKWGGTNGPRYT